MKQLTLNRDAKRKNKTRSKKKKEYSRTTNKANKLKLKLQEKLKEKKNREEEKRSNWPDLEGRLLTEATKTQRPIQQQPEGGGEASRREAKDDEATRVALGHRRHRPLKAPRLPVFPSRPPSRLCP